MRVIVDNFGFFMLGQYPRGPLGGLALTVLLGIYTGVSSFAVGIVVASLSVVPFGPVRWLGRGFVSLIRCVPSLVFLFWMYFMLPRLLRTELSGMQTACLALTLYHGAYMAEDIRGGILAVPWGQWEAARSTGLNGLQTFRSIVMPQAIRAIVPALINRFVNLFMYTSIVALIGIFDLMYAAIAINNRDLVYPLEIFGFVGVVYFVFCYGITRIGRMLERRWDWAPRIRTFTAAV